MSFLNVKNRAESTLASGITDVATELTLATGEGALFPATNFHITIEDEILLCSSRTGDVLTVVREQEGTTAVAHAQDVAVELRITAEVVTEIQEVSFEKIETIVTSGDANNIDFDNIPAGYKEFLIVGELRTSVYNSNPYLNINADMGSNYYYTCSKLYSSYSGNTSTGDTKVPLYNTNGMTTESWKFFKMEILQMDYDLLQKSGQFWMGGDSCSQQGNFAWENAVNEITRIKITLGTGSFTNGTTLILYGRK